MSVIVANVLYRVTKIRYLPLLCLRSGRCFLGDTCLTYRYFSAFF